jgi:hypothetical protein
LPALNGRLKKDHGIFEQKKTNDDSTTKRTAWKKSEASTAANTTKTKNEKRSLRNLSHGRHICRPFNKGNKTMKKLIEKQFIQGDVISDRYHTTLDSINYSAIHWGFRNNQLSCDCFKDDEIYLTEYITDHLYKGNQLLYYPELAKQIRKLNVYPCLIKQYPIDKEKKGIEFLKYLAEYANECLQAFKAERLEKYKNFNNIIQLYGYDRCLPLLQKFEEEKEEMRYFFDQTLTINGLKWKVENRVRNSSFTESINLRGLFHISNNYQFVIVDQIMEGTPFLALKCCTHEYNKGHVFWYDLSTQEKTTKAEALAWKKPH